MHDFSAIATLLLQHTTIEALDVAGRYDTHRRNAAPCCQAYQASFGRPANVRDGCCTD